jgi:DNA-directed RNA polymerase specialized sigma subunit
MFPSRLETKFQAPYNAWKQDPSPENATSLLGAVRPAIDRGIRAHVGKRVSPSTRSHARRLALSAIRSYDPGQSQLTTHIVNNLQGLKRVVRKQTHVLTVPERVELDRRRVTAAKAELEEELGREASIGELTDYARISPRRLMYIQRFKQPIVEGTLAAAGERGNESYTPAVQQQPSSAWLELVYQDLGPIDQNILDWTLGLHGRTQRSNQDIARRLRITPGAVSQRKANIQSQLDQREELELF